MMAESRSTDPSARRALAIAALLLIAIGVWVATRPTPLALGGDNETLLHPLFVDAYRQLGAGQLPLWTTGRWGGSPLLADPVAGIQYPLHYVGYALTPFPHRHALDVAAWIDLVVFAGGMLWCLGRLSVRPWLALAATGLMILNPAFVYVARGWSSWWSAIAWWPWLLGAALATAHGWSQLVLAVVALAAQVYAGYPQFALHAALVAAAVLLFAVPRPFGRRCLDVVSLAAGGAALAAPQVLPGLGMAADSLRLGPEGAAKLAALDIAALSPALWVETLRATATLQGLPCKLLPLALVLVVVGAVRRRREVLVLMLAMLAAMILASGPTALMAVLHRLPGFEFFAGPMKFFYIGAFLLHVLAGVGLEELARASEQIRRAALLALAAAMFPVLGIVGAFTTAVAAIALPAGMLTAGATLATLVGGSAFLHATAALSTPQSFSRDAFNPLLRATPADAAASPDDRWIALDEPSILHQTGMNFGALWGLSSLSGIGPLPPWREVAVMENATPGSALALIRLVGATRVVVRTPSPLVSTLQTAGFGKVGETEGLSVWRVPTPTPLAFLAPHVRSVTAGEAVAAAQRGEGLEPASVLVEDAPDDTRAEGDGTGRLAITTINGAAYQLQIDLTRATWVVVRVPYYRNWSASSAGRPLVTRPAGGFFLALHVDAGRHAVDVRYREPQLGPGLLIAVVGGILLLALQRRQRVGRPAVL